MTNQIIIEDLNLVPVPVWWQSPWVLAGFAIVGGLAAYLMWRWWKSRPKTVAEATPLPAGPPAHLEALRRLAELRLRRAQLSSYEVAVECSDILRSYIEDRFGFRIRYQTTREFLGAAQSHQEWNAGQKDELGGFLSFFDRLKFASESAVETETNSAIDFAESFVRRCIPKEPSE